MKDIERNTPTGRALSRYREGLAKLAGIKGRRNASLLGLSNLGVLAGLGDERIESDVIGASGVPPLTIAEVRHAIRTARRDTQPLTDRPAAAKRCTPPKPNPPPLGSGAASFVRRMIDKGDGATFESLTNCSPVPIPSEPGKQAAVFLQDMYRPDEYLFCGERYSTGHPGADIDTCAEWVRLVGGGKLDAPELIACNPLTGGEGVTKEGKPSFRCAACVSAFRYVLVEFDALPLSSQCAFWAGVILSGTLPLRSLTFSGGKSIHGLVEIGTKDHAAWEQAITILFYAVANPAAPQDQQADRACRNPDRLTRLAGATHWDKGQAKVRHQPLIWLCGHK